MPKQKLTARQQLTIDRDLARARSEAKFEELVDTYPPAHVASRDRFIRVESERAEKEIEKRHLDAIPDAERSRLR